MAAIWALILICFYIPSSTFTFSIPHSLFLLHHSFGWALSSVSWWLLCGWLQFNNYQRIHSRMDESFAWIFLIQRVSMLNCINKKAVESRNWRAFSIQWKQNLFLYRLVLQIYQTHVYFNEYAHFSPYKSHSSAEWLICVLINFINIENDLVDVELIICCCCCYSCLPLVFSSLMSRRHINQFKNIHRPDIHQPNRRWSRAVCGFRWL